MTTITRQLISLMIFWFWKISTIYWLIVRQFFGITIFEPVLLKIRFCSPRFTPTTLSSFALFIHSLFLKTFFFLSSGVPPPYFHFDFINSSSFFLFLSTQANRKTKNKKKTALMFAYKQNYRNKKNFRKKKIKVNLAILYLYFSYIF